MSTDKKEFNAAIRGYHHYRKYWNPKPIKNLSYSHEVDTVILLKYWAIPEKIQTGSWRYIFLKNLGFLDLSLYPKKTSIHSWKFYKTIVHHLVIPRSKTKTYGSFT